MMKGNNLVCDICDNEVAEEDEFCMKCGNLFLENVNCSLDDGNSAIGVCVICAEPFCKKHGKRYYTTFFCDEHSHYESYQGMARVHGESDPTNMDYFKSCLEQEGLHPFIYSRKTSPISLGGPSYSLFRASGEFNGHLINELKLMVPFTEVLIAEKLIADLNSSEE
ncbi:MAG: hypothetical protein K9G44_12490 [Melioribacteraceae bacterium]|nr:hypothetical protein [Melioribacteraceae bacterium]